MNCEHVRLGSSEISDSGLCGFCWKERAEKAEAAFSAIPSTFYIGLPAEKRLKLLVEGWRNAVVVNQKLQDKLDRYSIENPTICYQCGNPDKVSKTLGNTMSNQTFHLHVLCELKRARAKHKPINSAHEGYSVILEELDEFWDEVKKKREQRDNRRMYEELVQIAAMAQRTAEDVLDCDPDKEDE